MRNSCPYINLHTHLLTQEVDVISVYNRLLHVADNIPAFPFSAGLHPWHADQLTTGSLTRALDECSKSINLIAFGETGLDKSCKIPMQLQQDVFELHLQKAVEHWQTADPSLCARLEEFIEISKGYTATKILHGYNGSAQLTGRLLQQGFLFSVGKAILDPESKIHQAIHLIPSTSIFCETDTSEVSIQTIYTGISASLKLREEDLRETIYRNFTELRSA